MVCFIELYSSSVVFMNICIRKQLYSSSFVFVNSFICHRLNLSSLKFVSTFIFHQLNAHAVFRFNSSLDSLTILNTHYLIHIVHCKHFTYENYSVLIKYPYQWSNIRASPHQMHVIVYWIPILFIINTLVNSSHFLCHWQISQIFMACFNNNCILDIDYQLKTESLPDN